MVLGWVVTKVLAVDYFVLVQGIERKHDLGAVKFGSK
jgi:hypothetical protein